jgi:hypothetical protein
MCIPRVLRNMVVRAHTPTFHHTVHWNLRPRRSKSSIHAPGVKLRTGDRSRIGLGAAARPPCFSLAYFRFILAEWAWACFIVGNTMAVEVCLLDI